MDTQEAINNSIEYDTIGKAADPYDDAMDTLILNGMEDFFSIEGYFIDAWGTNANEDDWRVYVRMT